MSKKDFRNRSSQYDDYDEENYNHHQSHNVKKKPSHFDDMLAEYDSQNSQKMRTANRYNNKKRDKDRYNRDDGWN